MERVKMWRAAGARAVQLWQDENGATMVEYALGAALLAVAAALAMTQLQQTTTEAITQDKSYFEGGQ
jgi:Flp pilus assembly pilin Flp